MSDARETIAEAVASTRAVDYDTVLPCDYDTADAILSALPEIVGAMVTPLVWVKSEYFKAFRSGDYVVQHEHSADGSGVWVMGLDGLISEHPTEDAAKQAANDHHRAQVLGALGL